DVARYMEQAGMRPIPVAQALDGLGRLMTRACNSVVLADVQWSAMARTHAALASSPRTAGLIGSEQDQWASGGALRNRLLACSGAQRLDIVIGFLRAQIANVLKVSSDSIELERPLGELGLDSLTSFELKNRVEAEIGTAVPIGKFLQRPTVGEI